MNTDKMLRTSSYSGSIPYTDEDDYFMLYPQHGLHCARDVEASVYWLHNEYPTKPVRSSWQRAKPEQPPIPNETTDDRPA